MDEYEVQVHKARMEEKEYKAKIEILETENKILKKSLLEAQEHIMTMTRMLAYPSIDEKGIAHKRLLRVIHHPGNISCNLLDNTQAWDEYIYG